MAYCTVDEVRGVLARDVADATGTAAALFEPDLIDYHIGSAQAEVDARLAGRYSVPFPDAGVPALVRSLTVDVAAYLATLTYRQNKTIEDTSPVVRRWQRAQDILAALASGVMDLPIVPDPTTGSDSPAEAASATARNPYNGQLFGLDDFGLGCGSPNRTQGWAGGGRGWW